MVKQLAFYFNSSACSGCKTCQMACKDKHEFGAGLLWRRVYEIVGGGWSKEGQAWRSGVSAYNLSLACNHCEKPLCREACPSGAIKKRGDGIVLIDTKRCIGCRYCEWVCPYSSPQYDKKSGTMTKCHFCYDDIDQGRTPACVSACPMRALDFGELAEIRKKYRGSADVYPLPNPTLTNPALVIKAHRDAEKAKRDKAEVANKEEV